MNIKNNIIKSLGLAALVVSLLVGNGFGQTNLGPHVHATYFGMHSLASGQTLRLTVVNSLLDGQVGDPCARVRIVFNIYAGDGSVRLRFVRRVSYNELLEAGDAASFDFPATRAGESVSISTFASPEETNSTSRVEEAVISTLEVMSGPRTVFTLPGVIRSFNTQSDPRSDR